MPRGGAGRPTGSLNKATSEQSQRLSELAKDYTYDALLTLVDVAKNGRSDAARVSAANALLDRGYGKPAVKEEIEHVDLLPIVIQMKEPEGSANQ
jgi:H2-forming N5,N10-methylenetetrahydromethanopterin dehydrogenase-like enzyme